MSINFAKLGVSVEIRREDPDSRSFCTVVDEKGVGVGLTRPQADFVADLLGRVLRALEDPDFEPVMVCARSDMAADLTPVTIARCPECNIDFAWDHVFLNDGKWPAHVRSMEKAK